MANKRPSVLKREREKKQAERAAMKREERARRDATKGEGGDAVATYDDLEAYGIVHSERDERERR
jgi:hypothetical protein